MAKEKESVLTEVVKESSSKNNIEEKYQNISSILDDLKGYGSYGGKKPKKKKPKDMKEEIGKDQFDNPGEAKARAREIGCRGIHSMEQDGTTIYMPCESHSEYARLTENDENMPEEGKPGMHKKPKKKHDCSCEDDEILNSFQTPVDLKAYHDEEDENKEYGFFEGYGSIFGNVDLGNDVIQKGAFTKSLESRPPSKVKLLYQHKSDMPIGIYDEITEDEKGLYVKGRIALKTRAGAEAYELLKIGALDGLSIGFKTNPKDVSYEDRGQKRIIKEVDLMEVSLVTFPMNPKATITVVKGEDISIRDWEKGMRDAFNLSRSESKICAKALQDCFSQREVDQHTEIVDAIKGLQETVENLTLKHQ